MTAADWIAEQRDLRFQMIDTHLAAARVAINAAWNLAHDRRAATFAARRAALAEDICWLRDTGEHPERAAQRLGLTPDALAKNVQRLGIEWPAAYAAQKRLRA